MKKIFLFLTAPVLAVSVFALDLPKIDRRPPAFNLSVKKLKKLPEKQEFLSVPLLNANLLKINLAAKKAELMDAEFNTRTVWPKTLPEGFVPQRIMALGKNPGLGVRALHKQGITGKGVSIAIIDLPILTEHKEYKNNLVLYEEMGVPENFPAELYGTAVASLAVGKTVGVAPGAKLFYVAAYNFDSTQPDTAAEPVSFLWVVKAIDRIIEINKELPAAEKIKVLSLSRGLTNEKETPRYAEENRSYLAAVERARAAGIFVAWSADADVELLGRYPTRNPDNENNYYIVEMATSYSHSIGAYVPAHSRTYASFLGEDDYIFSRTGGISWAMPYYAGVYALAAQVNPALTGEQFEWMVKKTKYKIVVKYRTLIYGINGVINPAGIIEEVKKL